ncbi:MAG: hypothetical protein AB1921_19040 [Thermodesulfobacteriota bacterium]
MAPRNNDKIPAVLEDRILYWMLNSHDADIRLVAAYDGRLDSARLERAARLVFAAEPILYCRFVRHPLKPHWVRMDYPESADIFGTVRVDRDGQEGAEAFLTREPSTDIRTGPLARIRLLRGPTRDTLVLRINHTAGDGGGMRDLFYLLCQCYNALETDPAYALPRNTAPRGLSRVAKTFKPRQMVGMAARGAKEAGRFLWPVHFHKKAPRGNRENRLFLLHTLAPENTFKVRDMGRKLSATVNDVMNAALLRAFASSVNPAAAGLPRAVGTVDLRRYLPEGSETTICNLSGFYYLSLGTRLGADLAETATLVRDQLAEMKQNFLGLANIPLTACLFGSLPFPVALFCHDVLGDLQKNQSAAGGGVALLYSNTGALSPDAIRLGDISAENAFITTPAAFPPVLSVCLGGFEDKITMSAGFCASTVDPPAVRRFLKAVEEEIQTAES